MSESNRKYLFACGCPRSGTTALWRLLAGHNDIAIGVERYVKKSIFKFSITPELFEKERFFTYEETDTHYKDLSSGAPGKYYSTLKDRYSDCIYFGDKIPKLYPFFNNIISEFSDVKILFIYRNVFDVVQSYKKRFLDVNDRWKVKIDDGILDWNRSLEAAHKVLDKDQLILVNYETLFYETEQADDFFKGIGLEMNDGARARFKGLKQDGLNKDNGRESILTSYDKKRILKNARFDLYSDLANSSKNILPELNPPLVDSVQEMLDKKKANNS